jgi:hypothetical protein
VWLPLNFEGTTEPYRINAQFYESFDGVSGYTVGIIRIRAGDRSDLDSLLRRGNT